MSSSKQEIQETFSALDELLKDEKTFSEVVSAVFASIDDDGNGSLDFEEVKKFIEKIFDEMKIPVAKQDKKIKSGMTAGINMNSVTELFEELDEDKSKTISKDELAKFLKILFEEQKGQLLKQIKAMK